MRSPYYPAGVTTVKFSQPFKAAQTAGTPDSAPTSCKASPVELSVSRPIRSREDLVTRCWRQVWQ